MIKTMALLCLIQLAPLNHSNALVLVLAHTRNNMVFCGQRQHCIDGATGSFLITRFIQWQEQKYLNNCWKISRLKTLTAFT